MNSVIKKLQSISLTKISIFSIILLILSSYLHRGFSSLWLDESLSYWVTSESFSETFTRTIHFQGQSPLYFSLLYLTKNLFGESEWALRIPSLLFGIGSVYIVYSLGSELFNKECGFLGALFYSVSDGAIFATTSARPYSIALFFGLASLLYTVRFLRNGSLKTLGMTFLTTILAIYAHYLFALIVVIQWCALIILEIPDKKERVIKLLSVSHLALLSLLPCIPHFYYIHANRESISLQGSPSVFVLTLALIPLSFLLLFFISYFYTEIVMRGEKSSSNSPTDEEKKTRRFLFIWYLLPPLVFFVGAYIAGSQSLFSERYFLWNSPALMLLIAHLLIKKRGGSYTKVFIVVTTAVFLVSDPFREITKEDWRSTFREVTESDTPLLLYSGLIESQRIDWLRDKEREPYLTAPAYYYSPKTESIPIPFSLQAKEAEDYWEEKVRIPFSKKKSITLIGSNLTRIGGVSPSRYWREILTQDGFSDFSIQFYRETFILRGNKEN